MADDFEREAEPGSSLPELRAKLEPFDAKDLLASAGALELLPANAERVLRIQAFAHVAATLNYREGLPRLSVPRLREILNGPELGALAHGEDPFPNAFVEEVPFYEGSYAVLPGATSGASYTFRRLTRAIFKDNRMPRQIVEEVGRLVLGGLRLSDTLVRRAGLHRGTAPASSPSGPVVVPDARQLARLKDAVTFAREKIVELFGEGELADRPWSRFTALPGSLALNEWSFEDSPLLTSPIVQFGNAFVVCCPEALLTALNHHILAVAISGGAREALVDAYADEITQSTLICMRHLNTRGHRVRLPNMPAILGWRECLFRCDSDKAIYALIATDTLEDFNPDLPSGGFNRAPGLRDAVENRVRAMEEYLYANTAGLNGLVCLLILGDVGRALVLGFGEVTRAAPFSIFSAYELDTFAQLERGNSLALWRFSHERDRARDRMRVQSWSPLDEFGLYRRHNYSFYVTDDQAPNVLSIAPDFSGVLRREVLEARDWHAVSHYDRRSIIEVTTLHGDKKIPLYVPISWSMDQAAVFLEGLPFGVWILGPVEDEEAERQRPHLELAGALAYWLWQASEALAIASAGSKPKIEPALVRFSLPNEHEWRWPGPAQANLGTGNLVSMRVDSEASTIDLVFEAGAAALFNTADNRGERECLRELLRGFQEMLGLGAQLADDKITSVVDQVAPLGVKRMLLLIDSQNIPELDPRGIPRYRPLQKGEIDDVLDRVGTHLRQDLGFKAGQIPAGERNGVVKSVVTFCYREFQKLMRSHSPDRLLEFLIEQHEAVVREGAERKLTIPTRIACFESIGNVVERLQQELPEIDRAAIASRFVIEYAATQPPAGLRRVSLGSYDEMRALASHIIEFGMLSDAIEYELEDVEFSMLASGRLGRRPHAYHTATMSHLRQFTSERIAHAPEQFGRYWRVSKKNDGDSDDFVKKLDDASLDEFGFTMTEIAEFLHRIQLAAEETDQLGAAVLRENEVIARLGRGSEWTPERVRKALSLFSLYPRSDFLEPPAGMVRGDIYPWRYNRRLSYVRRPLIRRERRGEADFLWGNRHVEVAGVNLLNLCLTGRLKATSEKMRRLIGGLRHEQGERFNDRVAELVRDELGFDVRRRVKKIGRLNLGNLGDIDVLAADRKKRQLIVLECKDLSISRTPSELADEVSELLFGRHGKRSILAKHQDRVRWAEEHRSEVLTLFGIPPSGRWHVKSFIVVDEPLATPHLRDCPARVVTLEELKKESK